MKKDMELKESLEVGIKKGQINILNFKTVNGLQENLKQKVIRTSQEKSEVLKETWLIL